MRRRWSNTWLGRLAPPQARIRYWDLVHFSVDSSHRALGGLVFDLEGMAPKVRVANPQKDTAMMHEHEKSDDCVVPMKHPNEESAAAGSAKGVEERRSTKGNSLKETKDRT